VSIRELPPAARLALADGTVYRGTAFGAPRVGIGEVCFNTSITGYQEILTDPSYRGQTVLLTQPHIGNYGVNSDDEDAVAEEIRRNDEAHSAIMKRNFSMTWWHLRCAWCEIKDAARALAGCPRKITTLG